MRIERCYSVIFVTQSTLQEIQNSVNDKIVLPEGYHVEYGGQFESEANASKTLLVTSIIAFFIIFMLLFQEFKNFKLAGIILLNLPLALIGGVFSIYFTSGVLSIPAIWFYHPFWYCYTKWHSPDL